MENPEKIMENVKKKKDTQIWLKIIERYENNL